MPNEDAREGRYSCNFRVISDSLLADDRLTPADKLVLMAVEKWGYGKDHCHPALGTIARATALSESTVRRSLASLGSLGLIRLDEDPTNRTGKRIVRLWMADPDLHPVKVASDRLGCQNGTQGTLGVKKTAGLGCQNGSPTLGVKMEPEGTLPRELGEGTPIMIGSSSDEGASRGGGDGAIPEADPPGLATAVAAAVAVFGDTARVRERAADLFRRVGLDWVVRAVKVASDAARHKDVDWTYVLGIVRQWEADGGPPELARPPTVAKPVEYREEDPPPHPAVNAKARRDSAERARLVAGFKNRKSRESDPSPTFELPSVRAEREERDRMMDPVLKQQLLDRIKRSGSTRDEPSDAPDPIPRADPDA